MFGDNDKLLRAYRLGPRGKEQSGLIYQSQLDALRAQQAAAPTEPFTLTGGETREEQPRLFGAGDLGEIIGSGNNQKPAIPAKAQTRIRFSTSPEPSPPPPLDPAHLRQQYGKTVNQFLGEHKLQDKYFTVLWGYPKVADALQVIDNAPRYLREKAQTNLTKVTKGLSDDQVRLASMMVDSDSRDFLEQHKPQEFQQAQNDPKVMAAVQSFKTLQDELSTDRTALGWPVLRGLAVEEDPTSANPWVVKDRDGNPVADFKSQTQALELQRLERNHRART